VVGLAKQADNERFAWDNAADLRALVDTFKGIVREHAGRDFPTDPREQTSRAGRCTPGRNRP